MKKGSRFLIGLATATLTFGSLMTAMGPEKFNMHRSHCSDYHNSCMSSYQGGSCIQSNKDVEKVKE